MQGSEVNGDGGCALDRTRLERSDRRSLRREPGRRADRADRRTRSRPSTTGTAARSLPRRCARAGITGSPRRSSRRRSSPCGTAPSCSIRHAASLAAWLATDRSQPGDRSPARSDAATNEPPRFSSFARAADEDVDRRLAHRIGRPDRGRQSRSPSRKSPWSDKETRAAIQDALASLIPLERRVIELAYGGGLTQSEIATSLGWPIGTVKTRTRRALRHLRDRLEASPAGVLASPCSSEIGAPCL